MRPIITSATVRIDPRVLADHPLSKERIAIYDSGLVPFERYERDAGFIAATAPESLRVDLGWGAEWMPWTREVVTADAGTAGDGAVVDDAVTYDFDETDRFAKLLDHAGTRPYWSYCYVPAAVRAPGGDWRAMAEDDSGWVRTVAEYVRGMRSRGVSVGYHEVYNEPDLREERTGEGTFYAGQLADYLDLYRATSRAVREADPTARVGGPALAVPGDHRDWLDAFLGMVDAEGLPLDFLSFHHYGHFGAEAALRNVRESLARFPALRHVELHLNEYNAYPIDYPRGGVQDGHFLASTFAVELARLLSHRELTRTSWAQFLDSGHGNYSGMVDIDGVPKPVYGVYHFYQRMPVDRVRAEVTGAQGVGVLASGDGERTAAIVWNRHVAAVTARVSVVGVEDALAVTIIDGSGIGQERTIDVRDGSVTLELPIGAVALVRAGAQLAEPVRRRAWGIPVVTDDTHPGWSDLDEATATFRFGTGTSSGWLVHGADLLDADLPDGAEPGEWTVSARTADGTAVPATVRVRHGGDRHWSVLAGDETAPVWDGDLPDRPGPHGSYRVFVAVHAPAHTFVQVAPVAREAR